MARIYKYQKITDKFTTYYLRDNPLIRENYLTELCTLSDGFTYVSASAEVVSLPRQLEMIDSSVAEVDITVNKAIIDAIKVSSHHAALIKDRAAQKIRAVYSIEDEAELLQKGSPAEQVSYRILIDESSNYIQNEEIKLGLTTIDVDVTLKDPQPSAIEK